MPNVVGHPRYEARFYFCPADTETFATTSRSSDFIGVEFTRDPPSEDSLRLAACKMVHAMDLASRLDTHAVRVLFGFEREECAGISYDTMVVHRPEGWETRAKRARGGPTAA